MKWSIQCPHSQTPGSVRRPDYRFSKDSVSRLNRYIGRHQLVKPTYLDSDMVFTAVRRCNEEYANCSSVAGLRLDEDSRHYNPDPRQQQHYDNELRNDVHMLLATAISSNWSAKSKTSCRYFYICS